MTDKSAPGDRGRTADSPWKMPLSGWRDVALRAWREAGQDNMSLIASGVAFYGFLAMVPMLAAIVLCYGLFADTQTVVRDMNALTAVLPGDAAKLIGEQMLNVVHSSQGKKGLGLILALGFALYGAMNGAGAIVTALNVAYDEKETRSLVRTYLLSLEITLAAIVLAIVTLTAVAALAGLDALFPNAPAPLLFLGKTLPYVLIAIAATLATAALFRYGPDRTHAKWVWLTPGSLAATLIWVLLTVGFGFYVANFASYNATYGSLGAVVVLLTWLYLSAYILMLGAELNSELEHQTERDTTTGGEKPLGSRRAYVADTVAEGSQPASPAAGPSADASPTPPTPPKPEPTEPGFGADYVVARAAGRALAGKSRVGAAPTLLATGGLALLRREGRAAAGIALLATSAVLAWSGRRRER